MAVRLALLAHHYRADWDWHDADVDAGAERLERWRAAGRRRVTSPAASTPCGAASTTTSTPAGPRGARRPRRPPAAAWAPGAALLGVAL